MRDIRDANAPCAGGHEIRFQNSLHLFHLFHLFGIFPSPYGVDRQISDSKVKEVKEVKAIFILPFCLYREIWMLVRYIFGVSGTARCLT